jgi:hypothetical protein
MENMYDKFTSVEEIKIAIVDIMENGRVSSPNQLAAKLGIQMRNDSEEIVMFQEALEIISKDSPE